MAVRGARRHVHLVAARRRRVRERARGHPRRTRDGRRRPVATSSSERFFEAVFGDHPLGRPIGGSPESISAVTRDAVWQHYRAQLPPARPRHHRRGCRRPRRTSSPSSPTALAAAGWDLDAAAAPVDRRDPVERPHRTRRPARDREPTDSSRSNLLLGVAGPRGVRRPPAGPHGAQLGARRRDVVAALPGDPREARLRLLGLLVRGQLLRRRPHGPLRRMLAQDAPPMSPS